MERDFRARAERVIRRGTLFGFTVFAFRMRELWDGPDRYRVDGIWGEKRRAWLFQARADHIFDERPLHPSKAPQQGRLRRGFPRADLEVYHLKMMRSADRAARRARYEAMDPDLRWQPGIGYSYLTDEAGLRSEPVRPARAWVE